MAQRFIIKENSSGKYYHLSVSKGSFIVRSYENNSIHEKERGRDNQLSHGDFWKTYTQLGDALYHRVDDVAFWSDYLQNAPEKISETTVEKAKSAIQVSQVISIVVAILGILSPSITLFKTDGLQITFIASGYAFIGLLMVLFSVIVFVLLTKFTKIITTLQTNQKEQIENIKKQK